MIKREMYMKRIRPFIGTDLIKVMTGIRRCGVYVAISNRLSVLETKMDGLSSKVEKHNSVIERTYKLETDAATAWKRHDELAERVERLEDMKIGGTQ